MFSSTGLKHRLKRRVFRALCHPWIGLWIYRVFKGRIPNIRTGKRFIMPLNYCNFSNHASVFWGFYESAEIRLINRYLSPHFPVIELGGSLGIVSSYINSKIAGQRHIVVEANPFIISTIENNLLALNESRPNCAEVINAAIGYKGEETFISISSNNTESKVVSDGQQSNHVKVFTINLEQLIDRLDGQPFTLVCDIEGSEIELVHNEPKAIEKCKWIFMEIHAGFYESRIHTIEETLDKILNLGFTIKAKDGNVYYFERT